MLLDEILKGSIWYVFHDDVNVLIVIERVVDVWQERKILCTYKDVTLSEHVLHLGPFYQEFLRQFLYGIFLVIIHCQVHFSISTLTKFSDNGEIIKRPNFG